jgi:hypothetical protein
MNNDRIMINIFLTGAKIEKMDKWDEWYDYTIKKIKEFGYEANYFGAHSPATFKGKKILKLSKRNETRLLNAIQSGEDIRDLNIKVLPEDFIDAFHYIISFIRGINKIEEIPFIAVSVPKELMTLKDCKAMMNELKPFIDYNSYEIFELAIKETPLLYMWKLSSDFNTLKVLEQG